MGQSCGKMGKTVKKVMVDEESTLKDFGSFLSVLIRVNPRQNSPGMFIPYL